MSNLETIYILNWIGLRREEFKVKFTDALQAQKELKSIQGNGYQAWIEEIKL